MRGDGAVISGEAVEVEVRLARVGSRMLAFLLDVTAQLVFGWLLAVIGLLLTVNRSQGVTAGVSVLVLVLVFVAYPVALETLTGGRSLGKLAMGLRVVRVDGGPIGFRQALTRALVGLAVEWPGVLVPPLSWLVCLGVMIGQPAGRRLGDLAAGTVVIHERNPAAWGWVPAMPPYLADWAATLDLTGLDDDLALRVRHYLARNREIIEPARTRLGTELAARVARQTTPPVPPGIPGWAYLAAVVAERHRRASYRMAVRRATVDGIWADPPDPLLPATVPTVRPGAPEPAYGSGPLR
ncbi:RDD family protein [Actinocatenispora rupis]|uniref:Transporter n=2 Tax=Actinocatenispora rupis TaxID=519421 RepID=A0A8J3IZY7_9ACTN|nr:transporter [Actinocatenispora rupis]